MLDGLSELGLVVEDAKSLAVASMLDAAGREHRFSQVDWSGNLRAPRAKKGNTKITLARINHSILLINLHFNAILRFSPCWRSPALEWKRVFSMEMERVWEKNTQIKFHLYSKETATGQKGCGMQRESESKPKHWFVDVVVRWSG